MISSFQSFNRGATLRFASFFYDLDGNIAQPSAAFVSVEYPNPDGTRTEVQIPMTAPGLPTSRWTALWDTRGLGPGTVSWSVHSAGPPAVAVEDGTLLLTANAANLQTFS